MTTLRLAEMTVDQVRAEVREVLAHGLDQSRLADYLALVDWGGEPGSPAVRDLLGALEMAATEYVESDLTRDDYVARLTTLVTNTARPRR